MSCPGSSALLGNPRIDLLTTSTGSFSLRRQVTLFAVCKELFIPMLGTACSRRRRRRSWSTPSTFCPFQAGTCQVCEALPFLGG